MGAPMHPRAYPQAQIMMGLDTGSAVPTMYDVSCGPYGLTSDSQGSHGDLRMARNPMTRHLAGQPHASSMGA